MADCNTEVVGEAIQYLLEEFSVDVSDLGGSGSYMNPDGSTTVSIYDKGWVFIGSTTTAPQDEE